MYASVYNNIINTIYARAAVLIKNHVQLLKSFSVGHFKGVPLFFPKHPTPYRMQLIPAISWHINIM